MSGLRRIFQQRLPSAEYFRTFFKNKIIFRLQKDYEGQEYHLLYLTTFFEIVAIGRVNEYKSVHQFFGTRRLNDLLILYKRKVALKDLILTRPIKLKNSVKELLYISEEL